MGEICREHLRGNKSAHQSEFTNREDVNNSGWAVSTLQAALWAFQTTDSFEDALIEAVNLGGDADTIGAVCGQIAGAYYGYSAIPERWLAAIKDREKLNKLINEFIAVCQK
jgi:ADP-ribosyl-[dinitrogen reductase] hydrolase